MTEKFTMLLKQKEKDKKKYSFQTMTRKRFNDLCVRDGIDETIKELSSRILHNVRATRYIIRHCIRNNILHYRLSSALFPLITDENTDVSYEDLPDKISIQEELKFAGKIAKKDYIYVPSEVLIVPFAVSMIACAYFYSVTAKFVEAAKDPASHQI